MRATFLLLKDIQETMRNAFLDFSFDSEKEDKGLQTPSIFIGHVPSKHTPSGPDDKTVSGDPPFILIRFLDDENKEDNTKAVTREATVSIFCCLYSKDSYKNIEAAYSDILNMIDRVLITLMGKIYWENNHWWLQDGIKRVVGTQKELGPIYDAGVHNMPYFEAAVIAKFKAAGITQPPLSVTR
jgi:hypothetical protein